MSGDELAGISVAVVESEHEAVVSVGGELDLSNAEELQRAIEPLLRSVTLERLVFELADLRFMDSSGIAVLLRAAASGKSVRLRSPSQIIRDVIRSTGLTSVLTVEE